MRNIFLPLVLEAALVTACERDFLSVSQNHDHDFKPRSPYSIFRRAAPFPPILNTPETILTNSFDNVSLDTWSSYYAHGAHIAGTNKTMAQWTSDRWNENGVSAKLVEYEVFLNYPVSASVKLNTGNGTHEAQLWEDGLAQDDTTTYPNAIPAFHGYSFTGDAKAEYVYVGRGYVDDFARLAELGVNLTGKIALAKYGGPFRGLKVKNAQAAGMIGAVIFTDPGSDGPQERNGYKPYPDGPARQASSIQRGSVAFISTYAGDPTTPGIPSKPGVTRTNGSEILPQIPSLPISYQDAIPFLAALDGHGTPGSSVNTTGWLGGLNVSYSTGPAPGATISMSNVMTSTITPIWDVIGIINGTNADETILIGNHRDAWIIGGAGDPNSGSAILVELTKAFGKLLKTGWKPRRNIVICSWDGEEYGEVGSTEFVEEYAPWLSGTAISYLNIDIAVSGPLPGADSSPELHRIALSLMEKVIYPQGSNQTLADAWNALYQFQPEDNGFGVLGSGSDYTAFLQLGIGSLDFGTFGGATDPVYHYHSNYDSYHWMSTFGDPGYHVHAAVGQYISLLAYHLADDPLIPFDLDTYGKYLGYWYRDVISLINSMPDPAALQQKLQISLIGDAVTEFQDKVKSLNTYIAQPGFSNDTQKVQGVNHMYRDFQRAFVGQGGLPNREFYKNVAYAPGIDTGYAPVTYPGITEALQANKTDLAAVWVKKTADAINAAAAALDVSS